MHIRGIVLVSLLLGLARPLFAQEPRPASPGRETKHARATRIPKGRITTDGRLNEPEWEQAEILTGFLQQEPVEGARSDYKSEVRFLYDDETLYVGAMLYDDDPSGLVMNELKRDFAPRDSDMFGITLDTFHDKLNGYGFFTMPAGARRDSQVADDGRGNNAAWDAVWEVKTSITENGWIVEYAIPFSSLRFPRRDEQEWGLNMVRVVRRKNEISAWNFVPRSFPLSKPSYAGVLDGIHGVRPGHDIRVKPFALGEASHRTALGSTHADGGVDVKAGVGPNLVLDGTYRTDFAQVEADEQQINLTRFGLFFPEKREFFLENQRAFQIGSTQQGTNLVPFFSRRIGLSDAGQPIPLIGGARLSGKQGRNTIGVLNITTEKEDRVGAPSLPPSNYSAFRYGRDFLNNSSASVFMLGHDQGGVFNRVLGSDMQLNIRRKLIVEGLAMHSDTTGSDGGTTFRGGFDFDSSLTRVAASYTAVDPNFRNDLGFIQRPGRDLITGVFTRGIRPASKQGLVREYTPGISYTRFIRDGLGTETETISPALSFLFRDASTASVTLNVSDEALSAPFRIHPQHTIPVGRYSFNDSVTSLTMSQSHRLAFSGSLRAGQFWNGTRVGFTSGGRLRFNARLATSVNFTRDNIDLAGTSFSTNLLSLRADSSFSTKMFLNAFIQYNSVTREVLSNIRFNVIHHPLSDLFVVYNETHPATPGIAASRAVIVKVTQMVSF